MSLERTHRKCKNIRDRIYSWEELPGQFYERRLLREGAPHRTILEVGCGREASLLRRMTCAYGQAIGLDVEASQCPEAVQGVRLIEADAHAIPLPDSTVDVVAMVNVVEHFADPHRVLEECRRVLRPGGKIFILTVNASFPPVALARILPHRARQFINKIVTGTRDEDTFPAFYRLNRARDLSRVGEDTGLITREVSYLSNHPAYFMFSVIVYRAAVVMERVVARVHTLRSLRQFLYAVLEKPMEESACPAEAKPTSAIPQPKTAAVR